MALINEIKELNGTSFCVHKSDRQMMIRKVDTDELYSEAWDVVPCPYGYIETDIDIENTNSNATPPITPNN